MSNKVILTVKQNNNKSLIINRPSTNTYSITQNIKLPSSSPSPLINYYTKEETNSLLDDKLDILELNNSINTALKEAKDSGLFDGKDGLPGPQGPTGPQGILGEKGEQGVQGIQGIQGEKGADGAKGDKGDKGDKGEQGADGYTPVKGEDYFTEQDKQEFIEEITPNIEETVNEILGDVNLDGNATSIDYTSDTAITHSVTNVNDALDKLLNKVYYSAVSITSFTGGGTYEVGTVITSVSFAWTLNKNPLSIAIRQGKDTIIVDNLDIDSRSYIYPPTVTPEEDPEAPEETIAISSNTTFTLVCGDKTDTGADTFRTATTALTFLCKKYYGVSSKETLTSSEINELGGELDADRKGDFTVNAGSGQYIFFAIPSAYGTPAFKVGGFDGGFDKVETISHTNKSGHTENYDVYRSTNVGLGSTTVTVN